VASLALWVTLREPLELKADLRQVIPKTLELTFLLMVAGALLSRRALRDSLPPAASRALPVVVFLLGLAAVTVLPPRTHRIYYDEDIYENIAQNVIWNGRAQMCNEGVVQAGAYRCDAWEYNKEPNGFPFVLSLAFRMTGVDELWAHRVNHVLFALGAVAVYWIAGMLFFRENVALLAALVYILTPESLLWGATVAVEPGASAFAAIGVGAWILFCRKPSWGTVLFAASALAFACQFRPESGLVLVVAAAAVVLLSPSLWVRRELYGAAVLVFFLLVPHFMHLFVVRHEKWGSEEAKFSMQHVKGNAKTNALYYVEGKELPPWYLLAAVVGLFYPRRRRDAGVTGLWFVLFFGIFIPFYAGSYRYGADIRFALVASAPLAILAGAGIGWASDGLRRFFDTRWGAAAPAVLLVYGFTYYMPLVRTVGPEAWQARADHDFARDMVAELPSESIVLTHNPGMLHVMGQSAAQSSLATYQLQRVDTLFHQFPGGVYFHYNFWCNVDDPVQNEFCDSVLGTFRTQVIREESAGFYRYVLYRLLPRTPAVDASQGSQGSPG